MLRVRRWRDIYRASLKSRSLAFIPLASLLTSSLIQIRLFPGNLTSLTASSRVDALAKDKQRLLQMWRSSHHRPHLQSHSKLWCTHSSPPSIHHSSHFPFHWNSQASETRSSTSPSYPKEIAGLTVTSIVDLTTGYDSTNPPTYKPSLPLSSGHMIQFRAENKQGMKFVLTTRSVIFSLAKPLLFTPLVLSTSGTEPKVYLFISCWHQQAAEFEFEIVMQIKYYLEGSGRDVQAIQVLLVRIIQELGDIWFEADKWGLERS